MNGTLDAINGHLWLGAREFVPLHTSRTPAEQNPPLARVMSALSGHV
ncbi:MAG: hypothetical protein ACRDRU_14190 [Pseudonocardiaceae bacterium]